MGKGDKKDFPGGRSKGSIEDQEKYAKWYVSTGKGRAYLPKSERALAEQLALRRIYTAQLNRLRQESELLRNYELFQEANIF